MIKKQNSTFILNTEHTSYVFQVLPSGHLEHLYYGKKIECSSQACEALTEKNEFLKGNMVSYSSDYNSLGLEDMCLEMSSHGKGDIREPFIEVTHFDGSRTSDFLYADYEISNGKSSCETLPVSYGTEEDVQELKVVLKDRAYQLELHLIYNVFEACDVITRRAVLVNASEQEVTVNRLLSNQLDFDDCEYTCSLFTGAWAREMNRRDMPVRQGKIVNSSVTGTSSNRANPFVMLWENTVSEDAGNCYGMNLIYSGNHYEVFEVNGFGKTRFVSGINPNGFQFHLGTGEVFEAPEAVMTFSDKGFNGMSHHMHQFIRNHVVRGYWKDKERPVLLNSWEAAYFKFDEGKLLSMAKNAKKAGIELFVMDDGWFGERNDDKSSLGDWYANKKKLPNGIFGLAKKVNDLGLDFGLWVEPEMVNANSRLYEEHPDWVVRIPNLPHSEGRNQMILDLGRVEVQGYIIKAMTDVFSSANISYVKWDMNRIFSDYFSGALNAQCQEELGHRYVMGLYRIMKHLTEAFPKILFEGCCAGGNRFDLGILCYMPQIWASDNTDALCRAEIQTGYSYGYPMSVLSAHVSGCPNHQTLRSTSIETRFNVACYGILGYECNINDLSKDEYDAMVQQIALYKEMRSWLFRSKYYRIKNGKNTDYTKGVYQWIAVSEDKEHALGLYLQSQVVPNYVYGKFTAKGLDDEKVYRFTNRELKYNVKEFGDLINTVTPVHIKKDSIVHNTVAKFVKMDGEKEDYVVSGSLLNHAGVKLKQGFCACGFNENVRFFQDSASRIYFMEQVKE